MKKLKKNGKKLILNKSTIADMGKLEMTDIKGQGETFTIESPQCWSELLVICKKEFKININDAGLG